jgi:hypothetical protein
MSHPQRRTRRDLAANLLSGEHAKSFRDRTPNARRKLNPPLRATPSTPNATADETDDLASLARRSPIAASTDLPSSTKFVHDVDSAA